MRKSTLALFCLLFAAVVLDGFRLTAKPQPIITDSSQIIASK